MLGLQQGNTVLKEIHKEMNPESVERLLEETAEAQAYQRVSTDSNIYFPSESVYVALTLPFVELAGNRRDAGNPDDRGGGRCRSIRARSARARSWHQDKRAGTVSHAPNCTTVRTDLARRGSARATKAKSNSSSINRGEASCACLKPRSHDDTPWKSSRNDILCTAPQERYESCISRRGTLSVGV